MERDSILQGLVMDNIEAAKLMEMQDVSIQRSMRLGSYSQKYDILIEYELLAMIVFIFLEEINYEKNDYITTCR